MSQQFLGQIQPYGFGFAPRHWALCNGQILSIAQNTALFSLLGTMYGGNGQTTFALPNLQSRVPMHKGSFVGDNYFQGEEQGQETVTLNISELPLHSHPFIGMNGNANGRAPTDGAAMSNALPVNPYYATANTSLTTINFATASVVGGNQTHTNLQPYLTINWCIAMNGIFPARN
ncbi:MAG: hypothetical protein QOI12_1551 [Alphaproteobacteria bacterium]|jgi:microcystin-dependent protein|nr:hypothetical protein [Alphaproteobacteria bacterium]